MIVVKRRLQGVPYSQKWFARRTRPADVLGMVVYYQFLGAHVPFFFARKPFSTVQIDLSRDPETIQADMHRNVRYEIRRAESDDLRWEVGFDPSEFASFHGAFAAERGIHGIDRTRLLSFGDSLMLSRVTREGRTLAQHAYVVDPGESRARFLYSSSGRFESNDSALVGRANRWCHWKDMMHLAEQGICTYDMGGIAEGKIDSIRAGINDFKLRFGGKVVREDHWLSPLYFLASLAGAR